jgi:glycosyltransferase involved in cell wall biosynthesis
MHVLVTADAVGGVWTYARELITGLVRRGFRITLVSFGDIPTVEQTEWLEKLHVDFRPTAFRLEWMQDAEDEFDLSIEYLRNVIDEVRPDLLHLNQYGYGDIDSTIPRLVVAHSDVMSWWSAVRKDDPEDVPWLKWYRRRVRDGVAGADCVVAPSRWMLRNVERYYCRPDREHVIYNGRNPALFNPHSTKSDSVLTVGRVWDEGKQVRLLADSNPCVPAFIVGSARHPEETLRGSVEIFEPDKSHVFLKGCQSELQLMQLYSRATMYAATSCYEPFGLAPVEAAFSRCALLCNDIPVFRELWGDSALYFHRNDAQSLGRTIASLRDNRELRTTYANLAYEHARRRFTAERMVEDYLALYRAMVSEEVAA